MSKKVKSSLDLKKPEKVLVTLFIDVDILEYFMKQGEDYETRINTILREAMLKELSQGVS